MPGPFQPDFVEAVRNAGDIVRLVSDYVPLKPAGSRLKGLCPFHEEKTPSFSVDPNRQLFYCFGCQTGGDIFKFVQLYESLGFGEAVEALANRWGVPLPRTAQRPVDDRRERLIELNRTAASFFKAVLADPGAGRRGRDYLRQRGISDETVERLGIGCSTEGWDGLRSRMLARHFKPDELLGAGLVLPRKSGDGEYDRFRDRLMFPIQDVNGVPVAFGGRALGDAEPKYINSPETPVYKKGEHLYGLDRARDAIRREGYAIVVEGYLDLAAVAAAGFEHVVASLGTAFTPQQARLLARFANRVVVSYDGDAAGSAAAARSLDLLVSRGFEVRVVELPAGRDPDDFIRESGAEAYGQLVERAADYIDFLVNREVRGRDLSQPAEKVKVVNAILPRLAALDGVVERAERAGRLADVLGIEDALVLQELRKAARSGAGSIRQRPATEPRVRPAEARLVSQLLRSRQECERWVGELDLQDLEGAAVLGIVARIFELVRDGRTIDYPTVLESLESDEDRDLLTRIAFRDEPEEGSNVEDCLWTFKRQRLLREGRHLRRQIDSGSQPDVDRELTRLQQLARQRDALCE